MRYATLGYEIKPLRGSHANQIGRITTVGVISEFPIPTAASGPQGIAVGPDGKLWFTETSANQVGAVSVTGTMEEESALAASASPVAITTGPDGNLWLAERDSDSIAKLTPQVLTVTEQYVTEMYLSFLHRATDQAGLTFWSTAIDQGPSRLPTRHSFGIRLTRP